jgi:hypothetical protein
MTRTLKAFLTSTAILLGTAGIAYAQSDPSAKAYQHCMNSQEGDWAARNHKCTQADAPDPESTVRGWFNLYKVAKICADNDLSYDQSQIDKIKNYIHDGVEKLDIDQTKIDEIWKSTQQPGFEIPTNWCQRITFELPMSMPGLDLTPSNPFTK